MVCEPGLKPHEIRGLTELSQERAREGLPLHIIVSPSMAQQADIGARAQTEPTQAENARGEYQPNTMPVQPDGYRAERRRPYFS